MRKILSYHPYSEILGNEYLLGIGRHISEFATNIQGVLRESFNTFSTLHNNECTTYVIWALTGVLCQAILLILKVFLQVRLFVFLEKLRDVERHKKKSCINYDTDVSCSSVKK